MKLASWVQVKASALAQAHAKELSTIEVLLIRSLKRVRVISRVSEKSVLRLAFRLSLVMVAVAFSVASVFIFNLSLRLALFSFCECGALDFFSFHSLSNML